MRYLLLLLLVLFPIPTRAIDVGVTTITREHNWPIQLRAIRAGHMTSVRLPISTGFGNDPSMVDDLVAAGVTTIVYQSRDCKIEYEYIYRDLIDQAFQMKVLQYPHVQFYLEIGNEPDVCERDPIDYGRVADDTITRLRPLFVHYDNLQFVLGLGVHPEYNRILLSNASMLAKYDAVAYHIYGHENLWDAGPGWDWWDDGELDSYGKPVLLTEVAINGQIGMMPKCLRYYTFTKYIQTKPNTHVVLFWTVDPHPSWPQHYISPRMAACIENGHAIHRWR